MCVCGCVWACVRVRVYVQYWALCRCYSWRCRVQSHQQVNIQHGVSHLRTCVCLALSLLYAVSCCGVSTRKRCWRGIMLLGTESKSRIRTQVHVRVRAHAHAHTHTLAGYFTCSTTFSFKIHISTFGPELNFECTARRKKIKPKEEQPTFAWNALTSYNQNHT